MKKILTLMVAVLTLCSCVGVLASCKSADKQSGITSESRSRTKSYSNGETKSGSESRTVSDGKSQINSGDNSGITSDSGGGENADSGTVSVIYNVIPNIDWATQTKETAATFTMGDSVTSFSFKAVDLTEMTYIEFDLYVPDATNVTALSTATQFELSSSGACDIEEYNWVGNAFLKNQTIIDGWNHIKVDLPLNFGECNRSAVNWIRWYWVSPTNKIEGCKVANFRFTADGSVEPEKLSEKSAFIPKTVYPITEVVVALVDVTEAPYNADPTGKADATDAINQALTDVASVGGGTVWMPAGNYRVSGTISVPAYCTLHGDWQDPDEGTSYGTVIFAYVSDAGSDTDDALFLIGGSAGVNGLTVYYPEQSLTNVKTYPFTFYSTGLGDSYMLASVTNCTVINGYQGIGACVSGNNAHEMFTVENVKGTFLKTATEMYNQADVGTWKLVTVSAKYWAQCPIDFDRPTLSEIKNYTRKNAVGFILGDLEWTQFAGLQVSDCKYGIQIVKGHRIEFAGSLCDAKVTDCDIALKVDSIDSRWGMTVANSELSGSIRSIENNSSGVVKMINVNSPNGTTGKVVADNDSSVGQYVVDYSSAYKKPVAVLHVFNGDSSGASDVSASLQALLDEVGVNGGIVYIPSGFYRLDNAINVPADVELRGSAGSPARDQVSSTKGTVLLAYYGDGKSYDSTSKALITLSNNAGVNGVRIVFPKNGVADSNISTSYAIRGSGLGVYCVNVSISAAAYGVDFSGCDSHYIKKLVTACYYNAIKVGGNGGVVEGCLQNGTVLTRCGQKLKDFCENWTAESTMFSDLYPITRSKLVYLIVSDGNGEQIYNTFAYGPAVFLQNDNAVNTQTFSVGADNVGNSQFVINGGSLAVVGALRYNGTSYTHNGGSVKLYARLAINETDENSLTLTK